VPCNTQVGSHCVGTVLMSQYLLLHGLLHGPSLSGRSTQVNRPAHAVHKCAEGEWVAVVMLIFQPRSPATFATAGFPAFAPPGGRKRLQAAGKLLGPQKPLAWLLVTPGSLRGLLGAQLPK
jgi:hypothetical protein